MARVAHTVHAGQARGWGGAAAEGLSFPHGIMGGAFSIVTMRNSLQVGSDFDAVSTTNFWAKSWSASVRRDTSPSRDEESRRPVAQPAGVDEKIISKSNRIETIRDDELAAAHRVAEGQPPASPFCGFVSAEVCETPSLNQFHSQCAASNLC